MANGLQSMSRCVAKMSQRCSAVQPSTRCLFMTSSTLGNASRASEYLPLVQWNGQRKAGHTYQADALEEPSAV